jgi:hypothetical protein
MDLISGRGATAPPGLGTLSPIRLKNFIEETPA